MTHLHILNLLAENYGLHSYLEIGVQEPRNNLLRVNCRTKVGVDPAVSHPLVYRKTSDEFFKTNQQRFDLIFIDGLHEYEQVKRDFINSMDILSDNGYIVIHDTLPMNEDTASVPRKTKMWHGDVYRLVLELHKYCGYKTINTDNGCTVCWKTNVNPRGDIPLNWTSFLENSDYMNIKQPHEIDFRNIRKR